MKKVLPRFLKTAAALIGMLILFHLVENWRATRAWQGWKKDQKAKGTSFDPGTMAPPPVSDSENFAAVPMVAEAVAGKGWAGLPPPDELQKVLNEGNPGDWRVGRPADLDGLKSALKAESLNEVLKPYNQVLDALSEAARRPKSRLLEFLPRISPKSSRRVACWTRRRSCGKPVKRACNPSSMLARMPC